MKTSMLIFILFLISFIFLITILVVYKKRQNKRYKQTISKLDYEKNGLIGIPILSELSKVRELIKNDELKGKLVEWDETFKDVKENKISEITDLITEKTKLKPFCAYGTVKVATSYLSKYLSLDSGIEWIWARIFSLYGENEPKGRMLPDLVYKLKNGESVMLSSCRQNWDYLNVYDGAKALIALAQHGRSGEIYNVAHGEYNNLKYFVNIVEEELNCCNKVIYGEDANPFVSLQPDVSKIKRDTGWLPEIDFRKGIHQLFN